MIELEKFESRFSKFLTEELQKKGDAYYVNQNELIQRLIQATVKGTYVQVITFNYTDYKNRSHLKIHGKISNPIFGISENDNDNILAHRFTKPKRWRLNEAFQPLCEFLRFRVNNIVFYGTSLNDLDFDHYYWLIKEFCNARIFFCFTEYDENFPQKEIHDDMVENLISKIFKTNFQHLVDIGKVNFREIPKL